MKSHSILVLDTHTNQALASVRSLGRSGRDVLTAGTRRISLAQWSRWSRAHYRLSGDTVEDFSRLRDWAHARGVTAVLPMTERSCLLCNADRAAWEAAGITVGCAPDLTLLAAFDKVRTLEAAERAAVAIPPSYHGASLQGYHQAAEAIGFPCVVKSRFSDARVGDGFLRGGGASYVDTPAALSAAVQLHRQGSYWPILQGFVRGVGIGVSGLCDRGRVVTLFAHQRLRDVRPTGSGSSLRQSIVLDDRLREPAERLLGQMRWHGPVMVEFRADASGPARLMEVNGRFWGSLQLAVSSGLDLPGLWVAILEGREVNRPASYKEGMVLRWLWGDVKRLLHIFEGAPPSYPERYPGRLQGLREIFGRQPPRTRVETWDASDPLPAVAEWLQGGGELAAYGLAALRRSWRARTAARLDDQPSCTP